jgi:hypothetical protein
MSLLVPIVSLKLKASAQTSECQPPSADAVGLKRGSVRLDESFMDHNVLKACFSFPDVRECLVRGMWFVE